MSSTTVAPATPPTTVTTPKKKVEVDSTSAFINALAKMVQTVSKRVHGSEGELDLSAAAKKMLKPNPASSRKKKRGPKRASSAYMFFVKECRPNLKADNPTFSFPDMGKLMGATWKAMSDKARAPFVKLSEEDKIRYAADVKKYNESGEVVDGREDGAKRTKVSA